MKKLLEQLSALTQKIWASIRNSPKWATLAAASKARYLLAHQKVCAANQKMVAYTQPKLETLIRRVSKNTAFTLSAKATQIIVYVAIYIVISFIWHFIGGLLEDSNARNARMRPVSVVTAPVKLGEITVIQTALGTVTPRNTVTVYPQVSGILSKVFFKEGDLVQAGQLLALIDPRPYEASLKQAQGTLDKDKALLANAELDLKRYDTLLKQDSISHQVYATQKALVQQYKGNVLTDEGALSNAKLQLEFAHITSPINGRIGLRLVDPGNLVQPSSTNGLFVITQLQPTTVLFSVPQDTIPSFKKFLQEPPPAETVANSEPPKADLQPVANAAPEKGQHAHPDLSPASPVKTDAATEKVVIPIESWNSNSSKKLATGYLESIDNEIDVTTGTVKLRGIFANEDMTLFPNQFVNVRVVLDVLPNVVVIPVPAVQRGTPGTFVYRLNTNNTVSVVPVKLGPVDGENVQVVEGLSPGNIVVVDGTDKLRNGAKVIVGQASVSANPNANGYPRNGQRQKNPSQAN